MKKIFFLIAISILLGLVGYAWHLGVFATMQVEEKEEGGFTVTGLEFTGPYSEAGKTLSEVDEKLKKLGINCVRGFGIYYDDPKITPSEKCRSYVGSILEEKDHGKVPQLVSAGLRVDSIPRTLSVITRFPLRSSLSYMIGPMKAYPAIEKHLSENKYKIDLSLEIYDPSAKQILFIMQYEQ